MSLLSKFAIVGSAFLFLSCVVYPPYKFTPGEPTAQLKALHGQSVSICRDSKWYSLHRQPNQDHYLIPAGQRVLLASFGYYPDYGVTYSCYPRVGFKPEPGVVYYTDLNIVGQICLLEVVRESPSTKTGVAREDSIGPTYCGNSVN